MTLTELRVELEYHTDTPLMREVKDHIAKLMLERDTLRTKLTESEKDVLPLQIFMDSVFGEFPEHGDVDGFTLQDIAESCGLLVPETRTERCGEYCACVDVGLEDMLTKSWACYRVQPVMKRARIAAAQAMNKEQL
jgi:hypothetical protein